MPRIPLENGNADGSSELSEEDGLCATLFVMVHKWQDQHPIFAGRRLLRLDFDDLVEVTSHFSECAGGDGEDLPPVEVRLGLLEGTCHSSGAGPGCVCRKEAFKLLEFPRV